MAIFVEDPILKKNFKVFNPIEDTGSLSEGVFNVKELPDTFTLGYNSFKVNPNLGFLAPGSDIDINVSMFLDGKPVKAEFSDVIFGNGDILVSIKFDDSYAADRVNVELLGQRRDGRYIIWRTEKILDKTIVNTSPIIFNLPPNIQTREVTKNKLEEVFAEGGSNALFVTMSSFDVAGTDIIQVPSASVNLDVRGDGDSFLLFNNLVVTESMALGAGRAELIIPSQSLPLFSSFYNLTGSNSITSSIDSFIGNSTLKIGSVTRNIVDFNRDHKYFSFKDADFRLIYPKSITSREVVGVTQKYFRFEFFNVKPISGEINSVKIEYRREVDQYPQLLTIAELNANEFLVDTGSLSLNFRIGLFDTGSKAINYWQTFFRRSGGLVSGSSLTWNQVSESFSEASILLEGGYVSLTEGDAVELDFTSLIGNSVVIGNDIIDYSGDQSYVEFSTVTSSFTNSNGINKIARYFNFYYRGTPYELTFDAYAEKNLGSGFKDPVMEVYMDGFAFKRVSNSFGDLLDVLDITDGVAKNFERRSILFTPYTNGEGFPRFIVRSGKWFIKNISIKAYQRKGFAPAHTYLFVPIPSDLVDTTIDLDIDFINEANEGVVLLDGS